MIAIGEQFIFGYNIHFGLRQTHPADVFAVYTFRDGSLHGEESTLLSDPQFSVTSGNLQILQRCGICQVLRYWSIPLYDFRVGKGANDYKSLKWRSLKAIS